MVEFCFLRLLLNGIMVFVIFDVFTFERENEIILLLVVVFVIYVCV